MIRWVAVGYALMVGSFLLLLWTNPPDLDLYMVRLHAVSPAGDTLQADFYGRTGWTGTEPPEIVPGAPESVWVALPCRSIPHEWEFFVTSWDTAGNESERSNIVQWEEPPQ